MSTAVPIIEPGMSTIGDADTPMSPAMVQRIYASIREHKVDTVGHVSNTF